MAANPYAIAYAPGSGRFDWGSNNLVLNNLVVVASAYDLSGNPAYRNGVLSGLDYLLGRNALNQSYVTGYGEHASHQQHTRWYAHELNSDLPSPPKGSLAGGPNSGLQDPVAASLLKGCQPQLCYVDEIQSYSTNEITINWNSTLAWVAAFAADQGSPTPTAPKCSVRYQSVSAPAGLLAAKVTVTNTGTTAVNGWNLRWSFIGDQKVALAIGALAQQSAATVTARDIILNRTIAPGRSVSFAFVGTSTVADPTPGLFVLNGAPCSS
jgi:endoglucanase